jgi:hypothetical protein
LEKQILGRERERHENNIKINLTGIVYSVQCNKLELQHGAATSKQRRKKLANMDLCLAESSDTRGAGCHQGHIARDSKNSDFLSQELNYRRLIFPHLGDPGVDGRIILR